MKKSDLFDRYLLNQLSDSELEEFKSRLNTDPAFNKEFQGLKEIRYAVRHNARLEVKSILDQIEDSSDQKELSTNKGQSKKYAILTSFVIIILFLIYQFSASSIISSEEAFQKYYSLPTLEEAVSNPTIDLNSAQSSTYLAYQAGNYPLVARSLELTLDTVNTEELHLLAGLSALEIGSLEYAADQFNVIVNHIKEDSPIALWYAGLSYLGADKKTEALSILFALSELEQNTYRPLEVLKDLGAETKNRTSLGMIENLLNERDTISGNRYTPIRQKGQISDLTTRAKYDFHLITPIKGLKVGDIVSYIPLEKLTDTNPIGIAYIRKEDK